MTSMFKFILIVQMSLFLLCAWRYLQIMINRLPPPTYKKEAPNSSFGYTDYHGLGWLQFLKFAFSCVVLVNVLEVFTLSEADLLSAMKTWTFRLGVFALLNVWAYVLLKAKKPEHAYDFHAVDFFELFFFFVACVLSFISPRVM